MIEDLGGTKVDTPATAAVNPDLSSNTSESYPISELYAEIEDLIKASDAIAYREHVILTTQMPAEEVESRLPAPFETPHHATLFSLDVKKRKEIYATLGRKLSDEYKKNPMEERARGRLLEFLDVTSQEMFFRRSYTIELQGYGYEVGEDGRVTGMNDQYKERFRAHCGQHKLDAEALSGKMGGYAIDTLLEAKSTLDLEEQERIAIEDFLLSESQNDAMRPISAKKLMLAQEVREYYSIAGVPPDTLLSLWGSTMNRDQLKQILLQKAKTGSETESLCATVSGIVGNDDGSYKESDVQAARARALGMPKQAMTETEAHDRNAKILQEISKIVLGNDATVPVMDTVIFTTRMGSQTRAEQITYATCIDTIFEIKIMGARSQETQLALALAHELGHTWHMQCTVERWSEIPANIKEQIAKAVASAAQVVITKGDTTQESTSRNVARLYPQPALVDWYQAPLAYSQLLFLEAMHEGNYKLGEAELLALADRIKIQMDEIYQIRDLNGAVVYDLRGRRGALVDPLRLNDGIVYMLHEVAEHSIEATGSTSLSLNSIMTNAFGEEWLTNNVARQVWVLFMERTPKVKRVNEMVPLLNNCIKDSQTVSAL